MKKLHFLLSFTFCILHFTFAHSQIPSYVPTNGLVGWWPFNGNANDESGNGNNGTVNGATLTTDRFGNVGKAYSFNKVNQNSITGTISNFSPLSFTISIWAKHNTGTTGSTVVNGIQPYEWLIGVGQPSAIAPTNEALAVGVYANSSIISSGSWGNLFLTGARISTSWNHYIITYSNNQMKVYQNGSFVSSQSVVFNFSAYPFCFGRQLMGINEFWDGTLDDIAIYNRALSQSEITGLYNAGTNTCLPSYLPTTGLVGYWPFCGNANDESGNGNNGTVNGATLTTDRFGNAGKAYKFDQTNSIQNIKTNISLVNSPFNNSEYSYVFWLKSNNSTLGRVFQHVGSNSKNFDFVRSEVSKPTNSYSFWHYNVGAQTVSPDTLRNQQWYQIAIIINTNNTVSIFRNGSFWFSSNYAFPKPNDGYISWGSQGNNLVGFDGILDDISVYNRALTATEVQNLYNSSAPTTCIANIIQNDTTICTGTSLTLNATATSSNGATSTLPTNLQTGLVGYWPFNGNANDESGNGNNGTVNGVTLTTDRFGVPGKAYGYNGVNDYINSNAFFNASLNFSISIWIKSDTNTNQVLINTIPHTIFGYSLNPWWAGEGKIGFLYGNGQPFGWLNNSYFFSNPNEYLDVWVNHTIIKNGTNWKFYQNGILVNDYNASTQPANIVSSLIFGHCDPSVCSETFSGSLDDIAIWNRALTTSEVQQLYNSQSQITTYLWSTGATTPSITVSPTTSTTYYLTVTDANGNTCRDSVRITVNTAIPATPGTITGATDVCPSYSSPTTATSNAVTYSIAAMSTATSYTWTVPAGVSIVSGQGTNSISVTFANTFLSGVISVKANNACGSSSAARTLSVYKRVAATPGTIQKSFVPSVVAVTSVCGLVSEVYMIRKVSYATSYNWSLALGTNATITHLNALGANDTAVRVTFASGFVRDTIRVTAQTACSVSALRTVVLNATLAPPGVSSLTAIGGNFTVCIGSSITFVAFSTTPTTSQSAIQYFRWTKPANTTITSATTDSSRITLRMDAGFGGGSVSVKTASACGFFGAAKSVTLQYLPVTPSAISPSTGSYNACIGNSISYSVLVGQGTSSQSIATVFRWTRPANTSIVSATADSSTITLQFNAGYIGGTLTVKGQSSCGAQSGTFSQGLTHGGCPAGTKVVPYATNDGANTKLEAQLFPNPTTSAFNLKVSSASTLPVVVKLRDAEGRLLKSFTSRVGELSNFGSELIPGVYMIEVLQGEERKVLRGVRM